MLRSLVQLQVRPPFILERHRRLAQLASAHALGAWGCEFESRVSDHVFFSFCPSRSHSFIGISIRIWRYRLVVRTPGFHPVNRSSILRSATIRFRGTKRDKNYIWKELIFLYGKLFFCVYKKFDNLPFQSNYVTIFMWMKKLKKSFLF